LCDQLRLFSDVKNKFLESFTYSNCDFDYITNFNIWFDICDFIILDIFLIN